MTIDPKQLAEWKALAEAATEGPWKVERIAYGQNGQSIQAECYRSEPHGTARSPDRNRDCHRDAEYPVNVVTTDGGEYTHNEADLDFIAAARTAVPALIAEVERLREEVERLQGEIDNFDPTQWRS